MSPDESGRYGRRRFLTALGVAGAIAVAGCSDNGEQSSANTTELGVDDDEGMPEGEDDNGEEETGAAEDAQYELRISIMGSEQGAVEGVSLDIEDEDGEAAHDTTLETDMEGQATVELADGMYTVHIRADGFVDTEEPVTIGGADEELLVQLEEDNGEQEPSEEEEPGEEEDG